MKQPARHQVVAWPRMIAMYLVREHIGMSYPIIGYHFRRDHTTVMHGVRKVRKLCSEDRETRRIIAALERILRRVQG